jgi:hypothetical protein
LLELLDASQRYRKRFWKASSTVCMLEYPTVIPPTSNCERCVDWTTFSNKTLDHYDSLGDTGHRLDGTTMRKPVPVFGEMVVRKDPLGTFNSNGTALGDAA